MRSSPSEANDRPRRPHWLTAQPFAHRGLHGPGIAENSRASFEAAIAAGFGIELDVQASRDDVAMVFHDVRLDRLSEATGRLRRLAAAEASRLRLKGTGETVPTLEEALAIIAGRVPLLVEIKAPSSGGRGLCCSVQALLRAYSGPVAVMSFSAATVGWFARHAPNIVRGLVASDEGRRKVHLPRGLAIGMTRPDFLAYDVRSLPSPFAATARARGLAILAWTVRTEAERRHALESCDQIIHELPA